MPIMRTVMTMGWGITREISGICFFFGMCSLGRGSLRGGILRGMGSNITNRRRGMRSFFGLSLRVERRGVSWRLAGQWVGMRWVCPSNKQMNMKKKILLVIALSAGLLPCHNTERKPVVVAAVAAAPKKAAIC